MQMDIIQPFINAADAVLGETLDCHTRMGELSMEPEAYRSKGVAAVITLSGDIEGHIVVDADPTTAIRVAAHMAGTNLPESEQAVRETICELANQVIGNAVTVLNDQGFHFKVHPPQVHRGEALPGGRDTEALLMRFETPSGFVYVNVALRYAPEAALSHPEEGRGRSSS
jgi:chemotaxis protein CheX